MNQADQTQHSPRPIFIICSVAVTVIGAVCLMTGCTPESETLSQDSAPSSDVEAQTPKPPIWKAWPKPQLAFMLTSEQHGYFEPCGCTANQLGGMSRRASLLTELTKADWQVRGLDVGGLSRRNVSQAAMKMKTTLKALHQLEYEGVGVGLEELRLGVENLLDVQMSMENLESVVPFVSANLTFLDGALEEFPVASRVFEASGLKIGVTSVLSESLQREVLPLPEVSWKDPVPELQTILSDFESQQVDIKILLSQASVEESEAFAEQFPEFDIILTARGTGDPDPNAAPIKIGDTLIIEAGRKGKHVGVVGIYPNEEPKLRYQLVSLERDDFDDTPAMIDLMVQYQQELKDNQTVLTDGISAPHPSGATFVGADKCGECHTEAMEIWQGTGHAHALDSLNPVHKRTGFERLNGVNRSFDPECLACHVAGWDPQEYIRFQSGYLNEEFASNDTEKTLHHLLAGSQCENCHGPGSHHIEQVEADADDAGKSVRVTLEQAEKGMCEKCHDADNSPKFEFAEYWKKVEHYGLD